MPTPQSAHNAVTAVVSMYGEIVAEQAATIAVLHKENAQLASAINALGEQLKEQALGRSFNKAATRAEGMAATPSDPRGWSLPAPDDRPEDGGAEPDAGRDEVRDVRGGEDGGEPDGPGEGADSAVRSDPPPPGPAGPIPGSVGAEGTSGR